MTKIKIYEHQMVEKETNFEYPIYLYFQDEDCHDELVLIQENYQVQVKYTYDGLSITQGSIFRLEEHYLSNNQTTKEHFEQVFKEAIQQISERI